MIHIKRFIDKVSSNETRQSKDVVLPISEARGLRDEITKLLADLHQMNSIANKSASTKDDIIQLEISGGGFK